jgi:hypothetical protein
MTDTLTRLTAALADHLQYPHIPIHHPVHSPERAWVSMKTPGKA